MAGRARPWATKLFETLAAAGEIEPVEARRRLGGRPATPRSRPRRRGVRLLPYFDAYVVGCHPRELLFPGRGRRARAGPAARPATSRCCSSTASSPGSGTRAGRPDVDVTVEPLAELSAARRRALDAEVERVGAFAGRTPRLTVGPVAVGPHA